MNNIKWIFNPRFIKYIFIPFVLVVILILIVLILSFIFVRKELKQKNVDEKRRKNEK